jgi:cytochrome c biogenesis protein CcdA/thiol-disulfide isomerase/thioredoxin
MLELGLAWLAGLATVASPCVLPMLPLLLGASIGGAAAPGDARAERARRWRPVLIVLGFVLAFSVTALLFGSSLRVLGISQTALRQGAIVVLLLFGGLLLWPALYERLMRPLGGVADWAARRGMAPGLWGGFVLGLSLGLLWTPCAGPVLASILALVAAQSDTRQAAALLLAYALGSALPMLAVAYGGQAVLQRSRALVRHAARVRQGFGIAVIVVASAMHLGWDTTAAAWLANLVPGSPTSAQSSTLLGEPAPEFTGISTWHNSEPLSMHGLRGKVVLVDFWTYACVNCVRTLPHLVRWHARYAAQGLVVVGVHTPEFSFEREVANVQAAVRRHRIAYPVAQDNAYRTWTAWRTQYWPTLYLVDREGRVVFRHVGEGDEAAIEREIQKLLQ